ncbi:MAG: hypothetical protein C0485_18425 [Pirellula sp.]|nr:hypothetical protein [Pirellula sp.]
MATSRSPRRPSLAARVGATLVAGLSAIFFASPTPALTISLDYDEDDSPAFDPNGTRLMTIARAAADIWEWHILDDEEIHFDISWDNLDDENRLAKCVPSYVPYVDSIDVVVSTHRDSAVIPWFFDETPLLNEEFDPVTAQLFRDINPTHADNSFAGPNVPLLEVGVSTNALTNSAAIGNLDLLTALMHEFGHGLGMNFSATDDDYDFDSADIGGLDVGAVEGPGYELVLSTALMNDSIAVPGQRTFPSATDILATHDQNGYTNFNLRRIDLFGGHSEDWNDTLNWIGGKSPEWFNDAFARSGGSVRIDSGLKEVRSFLIDEGSQVFLAGSSNLKVIHELRLGNAANATRGEIHVGNFSGSPWLDVESLKLEKGLVHLVSQNALLSVKRGAQIDVNGTLMGAGTVEVQGELNNDGEISAGTFFLFGTGGNLILAATGNGKLDLDGGREPILNGDFSAFAFPGEFGDEFGRINAVSGNLHVLSPLADSFNGTAAIGAGRTMHFYQPWSFGGNLVLKGGTAAADAALLTGADIQFGGTTTVEQGIATIDAPLATGQLTRINVKNGARLNLTTSKLGPSSNPTEYQGNFTLDASAALNVDLPGTSWQLKKSLTMAAGSTVLGDNIVNRGRIQGAGNLAVARVDNSGVVAPAAELKIPNGLFNQTTAGRLEMDLGGFAQGVSFDVLRAGTAQLAGTLAIKLADNFLPAVGTQFDLLTASQVLGTFSTLEWIAPTDVHFSGQLVYAANKVSFRVTEASFTGDFDFDGDVDGNDLLVWKNSFGMGQPSGSAGDVNGDHLVDGADLLALQRQLGRRVNTPRAGGVGGIGGVGGVGNAGVLQNVPEPATRLLALAALATIPLTRRSRC